MILCGTALAEVPELDVARNPTIEHVDPKRVDVKTPVVRLREQMIARCFLRRHVARPVRTKIHGTANRQADVRNDDPHARLRRALESAPSSEIQNLLLARVTAKLKDISPCLRANHRLDG